MDEKIIIFFDLDDTLMHTNEFQKAAIKQGYSIIEKSIQDSIDKYLKAYEEYKYQTPHFLFEKVLKNEKIKNHKELSHKAGEEYIKYEKESQINHLNEEFETSIRLLKNHEIEFGLITQGEKSIQENKIKNLNLRNHIPDNNIFIFEDKNSNAFKKVRKKFSEYKCYYIGDKEDKDVLEPRKANFIAIRFDNPKGRKYQIGEHEDYDKYESLLECIQQIIEENK